MAKGNFTAYQQLKPTESKIGDIYASNIDYMVKLGNIEKARKMKELEQRNASLDEFSKSIKIEAKETDKYLTDMNVKLTTDTTTLIGNAMHNAYNSTNDGEKQKWMRIAQTASESYKAIQNTFGGGNFLKMINDTRTFAESGEAFDQSEQIKLTKAFENNLWANKMNEDGTISFIAKTGENINDPQREYTVGEMAILAQAKAEVNLLEDTKTAGKGLYSYMSDVAGKMMDEYVSDPTGNRSITKKEFVRKKGEIDFDTQFGGFNMNRPKFDKFGQFAIKTIGALPTSEAKHEQVRQAYVDKLWSYTGATEKDVVGKSELDIANDRATLEGKRLSNQKTRMDIANPNRGNGGGSNNPEFAVVEGSLKRQTSGGTEDFTNSTIIKTKNGTYAMMKVPKQGGGLEIKYAKVGTDQYGNQAFEKFAPEAQVRLDLQSGGVDFDYFYNKVKNSKNDDGTPKRSYFKNKSKNKVGTIKYDDAYKPSQSGSGDPFSTQLPSQ